MKRKLIPKEFLGAFKAGHYPSAKEFIDEEFSSGLLRLSELGVLWAQEALNWLTQFNNEYHRGVFTKDDLVDLTKGQRGRRERYGAQNARQRDALTKRAEYDIDRAPSSQSEDALIALIDLKREMEKSNKQ